MSRLRGREGEDDSLGALFEILGAGLAIPALDRASTLTS